MSQECLFRQLEDFLPGPVDFLCSPSHHAQTKPLYQEDGVNCVNHLHITTHQRLSVLVFVLEAGAGRDSMY